MNDQTSQFRMILPPPNITGRLHMGHAYEHSLIDATLRFERLQGKNATLTPGLDHAAIATNALLERQLKEEGTSKEALGRAAFDEYAWKWKENCQDQQLTQMKALGLSADWDRLTFTLDPHPADITRRAFIKLFQEGHIYRAERSGAYCPSCQTSLSDIEITNDKTCSRCSSLIELRSSPQWYLKLKEISGQAKALILDGSIEITPASKRDEMLQWCDNLHDWCISRQLWWGHPIPMETKDGAWRSFPAGDPGFQWKQEEDTLDTWFSSALWPISTRRGSEKGPLDLLITGNDLLFFWALRMIILCTHLEGQAPFKAISFHGMIRDENGLKMSKSLGNTIDPLPIIKEHGSDTLRLALLRSSLPGADANLGESALKSARASLKKIESITSFAEQFKANEGRGDGPLERWLLDKLSITIKEYSSFMRKHEYAHAFKTLSNFLERDLSDFFIPSRKATLFEGDLSARGALMLTLRSLLSMLSPFAPQTSKQCAERLDLTIDQWPSAPDEDLKARADGDTLRDAISSIRSHRAKEGMKAKAPLNAEIEGFALAEDLIRLGNLNLSTPLKAARFDLKGATMLLETQKEDSDEHLKRLERDLLTWKERYSNSGFQAKAPKEKIEELRLRIESAQKEISDQTSP